MYANDIVQFQTAAVLYDRDWRFHIEKKVWLTKVPGVEPMQKTNAFEKGVYTVFDPSQWRKVQVEMTIEYCKLADKPMIPTPLLLQQQHQQQQQQQQQQMTPALLQQQMQQSFPPLTSLSQNSNGPAGSSSSIGSGSMATKNTNTNSAPSFKFFFA